MNVKNQNDVLDLYSFTGEKSHGHLCLLSAAQVERSSGMNLARLLQMLLSEQSCLKKSGSSFYKDLIFRCELQKEKVLHGI